MDSCIGIKNSVGNFRSLLDYVFIDQSSKVLQRTNFHLCEFFERSFAPLNDIPLIREKSRRSMIFYNIENVVNVIEYS